MKESEFIELLNLYVDHEIAAQDAARLEAEVLGNPHRRLVYRQYCQIHKACSQLGDQFQVAMAPKAWEETLPNGGRNWTVAAAAMGLLAAACFTVVIVVRSHVPAPLALASPSQAVALDRPSPVSPIASYRRELQPVVDMRSLSLDGGNSGSVVLASEANENDPFAWMNGVRMGPVPSVSIDQFFRSNPVLLEPAKDTRRSASALQAPVEMAAFRFQR